MKVETFLIKKLDRKQNHLIRIHYGNNSSITTKHHELIQFYLKNLFRNIFKRKIACISIDKEFNNIVINIITKDYEWKQ